MVLGYFSSFNCKPEMMWFRAISRRLQELIVRIVGFLGSMFNEQSGLLLMIRGAAHLTISHGEESNFKEDRRS